MNFCDFHILKTQKLKSTKVEKGVTFAFCHFCYFCVLCSPYLLVLSVWLTLVQAEQQDVGRAKAKISVEEMLKLHRKRRDDDKLFSINSPRKNEAKQVRNKIFKKLTKINKKVSDNLTLNPLGGLRPVKHYRFASLVYASSLRSSDFKTLVNKS